MRKYIFSKQINSESVQEFLNWKEESTNYEIFLNSLGGLVNYSEYLLKIFTEDNAHLIAGEFIGSCASTLFYDYKLNKSVLNEKDSFALFHLTTKELYTDNNTLMFIKQLEIENKEKLALLSNVLTKTEIKQIKDGKDIYIKTIRLL